MKFSDFPERDDVLRAGWAPIYVRRFLRRVGGLNPYGEPKYRIVLAEKIHEWHGGRWHDWPENATLQDMGGMKFEADKELQKHVIELAHKGIPPQELYAELVRLVPTANKPVRVVEEMRFVQRYPYVKGWIFQRWRPASQFGSRIWWEAQTVQGRPDLPMLGPFPEKGAYELIDRLEMTNKGVIQNVSSYAEIPPMGNLERAINFLEGEHFEENYCADPETRRMLRLHEYQVRLQKQFKNERHEREAMIADILKPYLSSSLAGGAMRTELANRAGVTSHVGN